MHEVRVYRNADEGTRWWAEDDRGFTGGADTLDDLMSKVNEWADFEGTRDELSIRHIDDPLTAAAG